MTIADFVIILLLAIVIEMVNASLGMGWGTIFTPILILIGFPTVVAVPAVLLSQGLGSIAASVFHTKFENASFEPGSIELKTAAIIGGFGVVASLTAALLAVNIDKTVLNTYIGALVLSMGAVILMNRRFKFSWKKIIGIGLLSAFNKGISGGGFGPIVTGGQIMAGQPVVVKVDSFPAESFTAKVTRIADQAEFTPRNVQTAEGRATTVFAVKLAVENADGRLKPGMPADVFFNE